MVKIEEPTDSERLDALVRQFAQEHKLVLDVNGWSRMTYDLFVAESRLAERVHVARLDSFTTTSGEIHVFDERGLAFAEALGSQLEKEFELKEALIRRS